MLNIRRIRTAYNHSLKQLSRLPLCTTVIDIPIILSKLWRCLVVSWSWLYWCSLCSLVKTCSPGGKVKFRICTSPMSGEKIFSYVGEVCWILIIARSRQLIIFVKTIFYLSSRSVLICRVNSRYGRNDFRTGSLKSMGYFSNQMDQDFCFVAICSLFYLQLSSLSA